MPRRKALTLYTAFFLYAFAVMLFCTKSSPLFALNDWYDANVYFTMGRGWARSMLPYVSLEDNKGPLLYFIYMIAGFIRGDGFLGMYIIQSLFLGVTAVFAYKAAGFFITGTAWRSLAALLSASLFLDGRIFAPGFDMGGGGPDELCRAFVFAGFYFFMLYFLGKEKYLLRHTFFQGCLMAAVFMMKYSIAVFWAGFLIYIFFDLLRGKEYAYLLRHATAMLAGFCAITLPFFAYFAANGALGDFLRCYFGLNAVYSSQTVSNPLLALPYGLVQCAYLLLGNATLSVFTAAGLIYILMFVKGRLRPAYAISFVMISAILFTGKVHAYTLIPYTVFAMPGVAALFAGLKKAVSGAAVRLTAARPAVKSALALAAAAGISLITVFSNGLVECPIFKYAWVTVRPAQQEVADAIMRDAESVGASPQSLLEVNSLDSGFYLALDALPQERFFYIPNIPYDIYPDPLDRQIKCVMERSADYVIATFLTQDYISADNVSFDSDAERLLSAELLSNYDEIAVFRKTVYRTDKYYHVFRVKQR